jgi:hypothetical protein
LNGEAVSFLGYASDTTFSNKRGPPLSRYNEGGDDDAESKDNSDYDALAKNQASSPCNNSNNNTVNRNEHSDKKKKETHKLVLAHADLAGVPPASSHMGTAHPLISASSVLPPATLAAVPTAASHMGTNHPLISASSVSSSSSSRPQPWWSEDEGEEKEEEEEDENDDLREAGKDDPTKGMCTIDLVRLCNIKR